MFVMHETNCEFSSFKEQCPDADILLAVSSIVVFEVNMTNHSPRHYENAISIALESTSYTQTLLCIVYLKEKYFTF